HEVLISSTTSEGALQSAEAKLQATRAQFGSSQTKVDAAAARVREAEANYDKASKDLDRLKELVAKDEVSQREFDAASSVAAAAKAELDSVNAALVAARQDASMWQNNVKQSEADLSSARTVPGQAAVKTAQAGSAEAKVKQMKASLDQARFNLQCT